MKELLNKELKLVLHPTNILFIPLAFMLFIPNYPYLVIMFYTCPSKNIKQCSPA